MGDSNAHITPNAPLLGNLRTDSAFSSQRVHGLEAFKAHLEASELWCHARRRLKYQCTVPAINPMAAQIRAACQSVVLTSRKK